MQKIRSKNIAWCSLTIAHKIMFLAKLMEIPGFLRVSIENIEFF